MRVCRCWCCCLNTALDAITFTICTAQNADFVPMHGLQPFHSVNKFNDSTPVRSACSVVAIRIINIRFYIYRVTDWVRLNVVLQIEVHRVVEHEVEKPTTLKCSKEITVSIKIITCNNKSSAVDEMDDRLDTIDTGQNMGALLCPFRAWGLGLHNTVLPGPRPSSVSSGILLQFPCQIPLRYPGRRQVRSWS